MEPLHPPLTPLHLPQGWSGVREGKGEWGRGTDWVVAVEHVIRPAHNESVEGGRGGRREDDRDNLGRAGRQHPEGWQELEHVGRVEGVRRGGRTR